MTIIFSFVRAMVARNAPSSLLTLRAADEFQEKIVRNTLITALMAGAAVYGLPASAQTANVGSASMTIQTNIPGYCSSLAAQGPQDVLDLGDLTGATGQLVNDFAQNATKTLASSYYCNAPSKVTIEAEPLKSTVVATVGDTQSFTNRVDYTALVNWGGEALEVASTEPPGGKEFDIGQATIGEMKLTLSDPRVDGPRNLRPVAGSYEGKVTLTISLN
jgi:hypothetical protein